MFSEKLLKKLNQILDKFGFPKELVAIIFNYADFPKYGEKDLEKFNEARVVGRILFNDLYPQNSINSVILWRKKHKPPCPIFDSLSTENLKNLEGYDDKIALQKRELYRTACRNVLKTKILSSSPGNVGDSNNVKVVLYKKMEVLNLFKEHVGELEKLSNVEAWEPFKNFNLSVLGDDKDLTWEDLFNLIYSCQQGLPNVTEGISSIDFDCKNSKIILLVKLKEIYF
jgi:hypothetical protein